MFYSSKSEMDGVGFCRICETTVDLRYNIFAKDNVDFLIMLRLLTNVQFDENDDWLPKYICINCAGRLPLSYAFKIQVETTDRKLRDEHLRKERLHEEDLRKERLREEDLTKERLRDEHLRTEDFRDEHLRTEVLRLASQESDIMIMEDDIKEEIEDYEFQEEYLEEFDEPKPVKSPPFDELEEIEAYEDKFKTESSVCGVFISPYVRGTSNENSTVNPLTDTDPLERINTQCATNEERVESDENSRNDNETEAASNMEKIIAFRIEEVQKSQQCKKSANSKATNQPTELTCSFCFVNFPCRKELYAHIKTHGAFRFKCPTCLRCFSRKETLILHQLKHTSDPNQFGCQQCSRKYTNPGNLARHVRTAHENKKKFACEICGKAFGRLDVLKLHQSVHIKVKVFECDECSIKCKTQFGLDTHKKLHNPVLGKIMKAKRDRYQRNMEILACPFCNHRTRNKNYHLTHVRTHTGEKPFECPTCGKRFHSYISQKVHLLIHSNERPYRCDICGLTFRQMPHLKTHQRQHSTQPDELKPFLCDICGNSFSASSTLRIHRRIHTGEKPFKCTVCGIGFADKAAMKKHKLKHDKKLANEGNELIVKF